MDKAAIIKALRDTVQSTSNSIASGVSAPVDLIALGLRKIGVPVTDAPFMGSKWMENQGLTVQVEDGIPKIIGETLGGVLPTMAAAKAPQIASALNKGAENLAAKGALNIGPTAGQKGAVVWHGSPHKFDKFDASKIGTGEGAQAYGHGLYLADKREVSLPYMKPAYRDMVGASIDGKPVNSLNLSYDQYIGARAADRAGGIPQAIEKYTSELNDALARGDKIYAEAMQEVLDSVKALPGQTMQRSEDAAKDLFSGHKGSLYKVDLPDEHIAKMMDWDKPLSEQAHLTNSVPEFAIANKAIYGHPLEVSQPQADIAYKALSEHLGGADKASDLLRSRGIPGVRYLDGGSRGIGQGTSNFVVFPGNESMLKILERNGQAPGLMGVR